MNQRYFLIALCLLGSTLSLTAQATDVYRCDQDGRVVFSDEPCLGAKRIEVHPTQGMDKLSGKSRKGEDVRRNEHHRQMDQALRPLHGRTHEEMNVQRRRYGNNLTPGEHARCAVMDQQLKTQEAREVGARGEALAETQKSLFQLRREHRALGC